MIDNGLDLLIFPFRQGQIPTTVPSRFPALHMHMTAYWMIDVASLATCIVDDRRCILLELLFTRSPVGKRGVGRHGSQVEMSRLLA